MCRKHRRRPTVSFARNWLTTEIHFTDIRKQDSRFTGDARRSVRPNVWFDCIPIILAIWCWYVAITITRIIPNKKEIDSTTASYDEQKKSFFFSFELDAFSGENFHSWKSVGKKARLHKSKQNSMHRFHTFTICGTSIAPTAHLKNNNKLLISPTHTHSHSSVITVEHAVNPFSVSVCARRQRPFTVRTAHVSIDVCGNVSMRRSRTSTSSSCVSHKVQKTGAALSMLEWQQQ